MCYDKVDNYIAVLGDPMQGDLKENRVQVPNGPATVNGEHFLKYHWSDLGR